ncbi:MAG: ROK family protein [Clostridia bacterium]|nr:ROK family protein [Clostridia bacterium]
MKIFGLDIGGTNIKWGVRENGVFLDTGTTPSHASEGRDALLEAIFSLLDGKEFDLLGVSTAGIVDRDGNIKYANSNIPNYTGTPLRQILEQRYGKPTVVVNDIAASAYSEKGNRDDYYYIAIGTGVGGIYVKNGEIEKGSAGIAGQIGYLPTPHGGEIDLMASTRGLNRLAQMDARELFARAANGSKEAEAILEKWCAQVAYVITLVVGLINPGAIIIGGAVSEQGEALLERIRKQLDNMPEPYKGSFTLEVARGGNLAGVKGIIDYVKENYKNECT